MAQHPKSSAIHKLAGRLPHLFTQVQTYRCTALSVAKGQEQTHARQQKASLFDHLVGYFCRCPRTTSI
jgi:hypothetical protein